MSDSHQTPSSPDSSSPSPGEAGGESRAVARPGMSPAGTGLGGGRDDAPSDPAAASSGSAPPTAGDPVGGAAFPFRISFPPELPISARAQEITDAIVAHPVVVLCGETGSGKTTQLPKLCLAAGRGLRGRIACTQPRRVAALSVSRRVAEELGVEWGREVGCKVRFADQTSRGTVVKFMTDGMLLAEVQGDPMLREYDTVIIDEAHERSLNIDFLLGHLRQLRFRRPDLKIIVTSATIDTEAFSAAFDGAPVINVEGRTFPVEVIYAPLDRFGSDWGGENTDEHDAGLAAETDERAEALHYVDGAVEAVERVVHIGAGTPGEAGTDSGDVLVFLPAERDIREAADLLEGRLRGCEIVPLFGRLSNAEQQRVFASSSRRKIVLATNIAETSLTIPGIRYVVDAGLARVSRYSPAARTRRLPIERVAQANCEQRKGRAGRVAAGVCIRLYSEEDFLERPRFAQPEIQRANLADVILRLKAFGLGDVERFPFINPPAPRAIRAGYQMLEELGAIRREGAEEVEEPRVEESRSQRRPEPVSPALSSVSDSSFGPRHSDFAPAFRLSEIGRELARLPVDPTVGRMILQARDEKCLREVLVIAAGLSIQDPRERPLDKQAAADTAHRKFAHPDSDFLTLLNIWEAVHDEVERLSSGRLRRYCKEHFLSFVRMREWRDIHQQLVETVRDRDDFRPTSVWDGRAGGVEESRVEKSRSQADPGAAGKARRSGSDSSFGLRHSDLGRASDSSAARLLSWGGSGYRAVHRAVLSGLLGNVATRDEDKGGYRATQDRRVAIFPGSVLFTREEPRRKSALPGTPPAREVAKSRAPRWLLASEIVETSRIYARTCARLDPQWVLDLGAHVLSVSHSEPYWNLDAGRVMVKQRTRLYGLEIDVRGVGYGRIAPVEATSIFIREALVADAVTFPLDCLLHNRTVRARLESLLTRTRDSAVLNLDEGIYRFYAHHLLPGDVQPTAHGAQSGELRCADGRPFCVVSAVPELVDLVREQRGVGRKDFLQFEIENLRDPEALEQDAASYPEALPLANTALPLNYLYKPGQADDGVSLDVALADVPALTPAALDWAVPGHLQPKVEHYLRALPKELRRAFVPVGDSARLLLGDMRLRSLAAEPPTLVDALVTAIAARHQVRIAPAVWAERPPPEHLRVRVRVLDAEGRELAAGRDLDAVRAQLAEATRTVSVQAVKEEPSLWRDARRRWERPPSTTWTFGDVPGVVTIGEQAGVPVLAYPALQIVDEVPSLKSRTTPGLVKSQTPVEPTWGVAVRLHRVPEQAASATREGLRALLEYALSRDLGWLERDLRDLKQVGVALSTFAPLEQVQADAFATLCAWLLDPERVYRTVTKGGVGTEAVDRAVPEAAFNAAVEQARVDLRGLVPRLVDQVRAILDARQALLVHPTPYARLADDVAELVPPDFLRTTPYAQLAHLPRYLKAMQVRADRWRRDPAKDTSRAAPLAPYLAAARRLGRGDARYWLIEEFRVSVFAQELGTAEKVSTVRLDRALAEAPSRQSASSVSTGPAPRDQTPQTTAPSASPGKPEPAKSVTPVDRPASVATPVRQPGEKKPAPIKSLGALDSLFRK